MNNLNPLFKLKRRLERESRRLDLDYKCEVNIFAHNEAQVSIEDGVSYSYPETLSLNIENRSTYKADYRIKDSRFISEGRDLNGPGLSIPQVYRRMITEMRDHAKYINLLNEARAHNCIVAENKLIPVENCDVEMFFLCKAEFKLINEDGSSSTWQGHDAKDALVNASPWLRQLPVLIQFVKASV